MYIIRLCNHKGKFIETQVSIQNISPDDDIYYDGKYYKQYSRAVDIQCPDIIIEARLKK